MKYFYGALCVMGIALPYGVFIPWVMEHGLNPGLLMSEAAATRVGAFAWLDVVVSALAVFGFVWVEGKRQGMKSLWLPMLGTCIVGVSFGLPLFLLQRELHVMARAVKSGGRHIGAV